MRRFLYFFPGLSGLNPDMMRKLGVADRFPAKCGSGGVADWAVTHVDSGPAGSGCILHSTDAPPRLSPDQEWSQGRTFWVCAEEFDAPPGPGDLDRHRTIPPLSAPDHEIVLAGMTWRVPLIRRWDREKLQHVRNLPVTIYPLASGGFGERLSREHIKPEALADALFDGFLHNRTLSADQAFEHMATLLAVNYRIGVEECGVLGILTSDAAFEVMSLCIDLPALRQQAAELKGENVSYADLTMGGLTEPEPVLQDEDEE